MDQASLIALLNRLRQEPVETEWLEFKANSYEAQKKRGRVRQRKYGIFSSPLVRFK